MIFAIAIHGSPSGGSAVRSAIRFAEAAIQAGHQIRRVFFYHESVHAADALTIAPQGEKDPVQAWISLHENHGVELAVCIAAALRRGVLNEEERVRYGRSASNLLPAFEVVGLGQLIEAMISSDRFLTFAA
ncbi:MAG: sulfurtransferase complex subunit TusD [Pseudomonadales bacterium]|nr:sulfurtransferase complex subunit TusD [Pseudomonadales bacterium]